MSTSQIDSLDLAPRGCRRRHQLRRLRAGELGAPEAEAVRSHLETCGACQGVWRELEAEDARVRLELPLARLQAGLGRAEAAVVRPARWRRAFPGAGLALAAGLAALVLVNRPTTRGPRTKGAAGLDVFVGGVGEPRRVEGEVALGPGEAVRLRVSPGGHPYVAVVTVDENGVVDSLYFDGGSSLRVDGSELLPQSIVFDGRGRERLIVLYSDAPLARETVTRAAQDAFQRSGQLDSMGSLGLEAEEIDRTIRKPEGQ